MMQTIGWILSIVAAALAPILIFTDVISLTLGVGILLVAAIVPLSNIAAWYGQVALGWLVILIGTAIWQKAFYGRLGAILGSSALEQSGKLLKKQQEELNDLRLRLFKAEQAILAKNQVTCRAAASATDNDIALLRRFADARFDVDRNGASAAANFGLNTVRSG